MGINGGVAGKGGKLRDLLAAGRVSIPAGEGIALHFRNAVRAYGNVTVKALNLDLCRTAVVVIHNIAEIVGNLVDIHAVEIHIALDQAAGFVTSTPYVAAIFAMSPSALICIVTSSRS